MRRCGKKATTVVKSSLPSDCDDCVAHPAPADYDGAFDSSRLFGCVCDSEWAVGLGDGEVQAPEWFGSSPAFRFPSDMYQALHLVPCSASDRCVAFFACCLGTQGPDCALRHCPTGDNLETPLDETNCSGVNGGSAYNLCLVECAGQGDCNHVRTHVCWAVSCRCQEAKISRQRQRDGQRRRE